MDLYEKIDTQIKESMRGKDSLRLSVLRMLMASVKNAEIAKKVKKLEECDILQVIQKMIKEHKESIFQFEKGNRIDLVDKEKAELAILQQYVPAQMSDLEASAIVKSTINELGAVSKADSGKVIKAVMEKVKGRAEGRLISTIVSSLLK